MSDLNGKGSCALLSWALAAAVGGLAFVLLIVLGDWRFMGAIFVSSVVVVVLGAVFSWIFCAPLPKPVQVAPAKPAAQPAASSGPAAKAPVAPEAETSSPAEPLVKPTTPLPGEEDLDSRKGSWSYDTEGATEPGAKPALMDTPPEGGGDDLKQIKGIGPKLEQVCNGLGIYRFDQIAAWTEAETAWVDANLEGFKGRVTRDGWVEQAKLLADGGSTDFSKRVEDGDVY